MGFRRDLDISAKCPLYEGVLASKGSRMNGIRCSCIVPDFGFDGGVIVQCKGFRDMMDLKELFCDDRYKSCPYYQAWCEMEKKRSSST